MSNSFTESQIEELKRAIISLEGKNERLTGALVTARAELQNMQDQVDAVTEPPAHVGTFLEDFTDVREAEVVVNGRIMRLGVAPQVDLLGLSVGQEVRIDERMIVAEVLKYRRTGQIASVVEIVGVDRVLVNIEAGTVRMVLLAGSLRHGGVRPGDSLLIDTRSNVAIEKVVREDVEQLLQPEVPDVTYADIGGLQEQIDKVRDAVELPFTHPELYRDYGLRAPKGSTTRSHSSPGAVNRGRTTVPRLLRVTTSPSTADAAEGCPEPTENAARTVPGSMPSRSAATRWTASLAAGSPEPTATRRTSSRVAAPQVP